MVSTIVSSWVLHLRSFGGPSFRAVRRAAICPGVRPSSSASWAVGLPRPASTIVDLAAGVELTVALLNNARFTASPPPIGLR